MTPVEEAQLDHDVSLAMVSTGWHDLPDDEREQGVAVGAELAEEYGCVVVVVGTSADGLFGVCLFGCCASEQGAAIVAPEHRVRELGAKPSNCPISRDGAIVAYLYGGGGER